MKGARFQEFLRPLFFEVSLSNEDSFLVTGNLKHYPVSPKVITPADFISRIDRKI